MASCLQRQSRSSSRPAPRPASNPPPQSRSAHTAPYPSHAANPSQSPPVPHQTATTQTSKGPGMLAQMAATAGSVAVGSTIGHGLSSMLFGGGGGHSQPVEQSPPVQQQQQTFQQSGISCETQAKGSSHPHLSDRGAYCSLRVSTLSQTSRNVWRPLTFSLALGSSSSSKP